jgi:hypothetical protein
MLTAHAPFAKVFAVVRQHVVAILAQPQASPTDHFIPIEPARLVQADPDHAPLGKLRQGNLLNRTSTQPPGQSTVLHDPPSTYIDAVMCITPPWRNYVRTDTRLALGVESMIAGSAPEAMAAVAAQAPRLRIQAKGRGRDGRARMR